jgi:hypothetical protein
MVMPRGDAGRDLGGPGLERLVGHDALEFYLREAHVHVHPGQAGHVGEGVADLLMNRQVLAFALAAHGGQQNERCGGGDQGLHGSSLARPAGPGAPAAHSAPTRMRFS